MTRVDFYILPDVDADARDRFACRLAHRAVSNGQRVHVHVTDEEAQQALDSLMWDYPARQFLPHAPTDDQDASKTPVVIGYAAPDSGADQVLINLGEEVPGFFGRFERVAEIIISPQRDLGRTRYRYYRDRGYPLHHHELDGWEES